MEIINLDMTPSTVTPNAHAGQYDASRTVRFMLKNGRVPFTLAGTETITAEITRSDNTEVTVNVANTSSNYVDVVFDDTVCTVKGLYACELRLKNSDGFDIGSKNFALLVQRDPYDGAGVHVETVGPADICTFETTLPEPYQSVLVNIEATGGNGTPDNPNPIVGFTEANITRCGVNFWDEEWEVITAGGFSRIASKNYNRCLPNTRYYLCGPFISPQLFANGFKWYDENKNLISMQFYQSGQTPTSPNNARYFKFELGAAYGTTYNNDISINYPATDTTYHAYNGQTYAIPFGQTVYGGVYDANRGKLHVTHAIIDLGSLSWNYNSGTYSRFYSSGIANLIKAPETADTIPNMVASSYEVTSFRVAYQQQTNNVIAITEMSSGSHGNINIVDNNYSDADVFKTAVAGQTLAYELATPFDIDLTPEVISAVVGTNNVFADCGETTVKYLKAGV